MTPSPLLRARDTAKLLSVSEATIYHLAKVGKLTPTTFQAWTGKRQTVRFAEQSVADFIREHTGGAAE